MFNYVKKAVVLSVLLSCIGAPAIHADWAEDGVAICTAGGIQDLPVILQDGSGGAIIAWRDNRTINTDIYAQRVDADGNILWLASAMPVCTALNSQSNPLIVPDGSDGAIIAWQDPRGSTLDIYAQRINSSGYIQWNTDGVPVCTGKIGLVLGGMISDGAGGAIITWHDRRYFTNDVFAQRIGPDGSAIWTADGVIISAPVRQQTYPLLASDGANGAIIAWQDSRDGAFDIYAQRIDAAGTVQWTADGIVICNSGQSQVYPQVVADGSGGAVIAWSDNRNTLDSDVFAQRVDAGGNVLWTANGVAVAATFYDQENCRLIPIGSGEVIVVWVDYRSGSDSDIYSQRIDAAGSSQWASNGIVVCGATGDQLAVELISNGLGGAIATWEDGRSGAGNCDLYAQRINPDGSAGWAADGVAICGAVQDQTAPKLTPDGGGGALIAWKDENSGAADIYGQRVDAGGHTVTATLLHDYSAFLSGLAIVLEWTLSEADEPVDFLVMRASGPSMTFGEIPSSGISRDGLFFSFIDRSCEPGMVYRYRIDVTDAGGRRVLFETGPITTPPMLPVLHQNIPNPFNPSTIIRYYLPEDCSVVLVVFDAGGATVRRLVDGYRRKGFHEEIWNGTNENGQPMSSGVYFYRLRTGKNRMSRKMILVR
ncbi:MAG: T9SS type A sorting domain-containing protein [bacterium]|nr:MAG: T9SS type A sorting domain-containing protein [bacterium]